MDNHVFVTTLSCRALLYKLLCCLCNNDVIKSKSFEDISRKRLGYYILKQQGGPPTAKSMIRNAPHSRIFFEKMIFDFSNTIPKM